MKEEKTNQSFWNKAARIYDTIVKKDRYAYKEMYLLIRARLTSNMNVLELATGTGLICNAIADKVNRVEATDFSSKMIAVAQKKSTAQNVNFSVQDACNLPYADESFDCVIISNALHIMPNPELALHNISRVLKNNGVLIAPTFTHAINGRKGEIQVKFMGLVGFKVYHYWTPEQYYTFLEKNGFSIKFKKLLKSDFPLAYVEALKN